MTQHWSQLSTAIIAEIIVQEERIIAQKLALLDDLSVVEADIRNDGKIARTRHDIKRLLRRLAGWRARAAARYRRSVRMAGTRGCAGR